MKNKGILCIVIAVAFVLSAFGLSSRAASSAVSTVNASYSGGTTVTVSGNSASSDVLIVIMDTEGNQIALDHATVMDRGFQKVIKTGALTVGARYIVKVCNLYGDNDYTTMEFSAAAPEATPTPTPVQTPTPTPTPVQTPTPTPTPVQTPTPTPTNTGSNGAGTQTSSPTPAGGTVTGKVNGIEKQFTHATNGTVQATFTEKDMKDFKNSNPNASFVVEFAKETKVEFCMPIQSSKDITFIVKTDFGIVSIPKDFLNASYDRSDRISVLIQKGSLIVSCLVDGKEISQKEFAAPLTLSIPYKKAAHLNSEAIVAAKMENGQSKVIPFGIYDESGVTIQSYTTGKFDVIYNEKDFGDSKGHWGEKNILFAAARNILNGVGNQQFIPEGIMTRAMFATTLANLEGADLSTYGGSRFSDVKAGDWYAPYVEWAAENGIIMGTGNNEFDPESPVTREQMAVMIHKYLVFKGFDYGAHAEEMVAFNDADTISSWAVEAVKDIQRVGIINGKSEGLFDPQGETIRAEAATVFRRIIEAFAPSLGREAKN